MNLKKLTNQIMEADTEQEAQDILENAFLTIHSRLRGEIEKKKIVPEYTTLSAQGRGYNQALTDILSLLEP